MKRSQSPFPSEVKRVRRGSVDGDFCYAGFDVDMENLSMDARGYDDEDDDDDNEVAAIFAGRDSVLPRMAISVRSFTPIEVSVADTVRASQSPERMTLSPATEASIQSRSFYLQLHEGTLDRLSRAQRQAMQAAGLLYIPLNATSPTVAFTREWLTRGPVVDIYGPYKQYLSRKGSVTVQWTREHYRAEVTVANGSKNNVFIDRARLAPQASAVLLHEETIKILTTPYAQRVVLGYTLHEGVLESEQLAVAHNDIAVLFAHPIAQYPAFGMTLAGLEYRAMLTDLAKNVAGSACVSRGVVGSDGQLVAVAHRPAIRVTMEFATLATVRELCADGCRVLHFVAHVDADHVLLEDGAGGGARVTLAEMRAVLAGSSVALVQVTSYAKDPAGGDHTFFLRCGVPHVVALRPGAKADSDTTAAFTKLLHSSLAAGRSVADAFAAAQRFVSFQDHAAFALYPADSTHDVVLFPPTPKPAAPHRATESLRPALGSVVKHFQGRLEEAQLVCRALMSRRRPRWFSILGPPRGGKSQLVLAVAQYIGQRHVFDGGILYLNIPLERRYRSDEDVGASMLDVFETLDHELGKWQHVLVVLDGYESFARKSWLAKELEVRLAKHQNVAFLATGLSVAHVPPLPHKTESLQLSPLPAATVARTVADAELEDALRVDAVDYDDEMPPEGWAPEPPPPAPTPRASTLTTKPSCALM
ncbi:hypothetical protein ACHHYP_03911 [Achlya hypogyna]|uniref:Uncharacterized protein n=1 Tax=Achlya hypogyna TaxID=1202772 RepID=A0A1V9Z2J8_ACHHY|nr:hypothetical protein ACHHYP_03911 [Achlya hypogyna]